MAPFPIHLAPLGGSWYANLEPTNLGISVPSVGTKTMVFQLNAKIPLGTRSKKQLREKPQVGPPQFQWDCPKKCIPHTPSISGGNESIRELYGDLGWSP